MNKSMIFSFVLLLALFKSNAQIKPGDQILGTWLSEEKDGKVEIYKANGKYFGKLIWGSEMYAADGHTSLKDKENQDAKLRTRDLKDLVILKDFVYNDGEWYSGTIYDPDNGKTYSCKMELKKGELRIRGYIGVPILGRTTTWTRVF